MAALEKIDGWTGFNEQKNLRRFLDRGEAGEWLLDPVIEYPEVFATQPFHEMAARIGDNHSDIDAVNDNVNGLLRLFRIFLGIGERTHGKRGGEEQCHGQEAKRVHRPAIRTPRPNGCPSNTSTRPSKSR